MVKAKKRFLKDSWQLLKRWHHAFWNWYRGIFAGRPWYIKIVSGLGTFFVCLFLFVLAVNFNFLWLFGKSPSLDSIMHPKTNNASYVYSADGQLLCKYYNENRTPVKFEEINKNFFTALIDTEDERFYSHHGIDYGGIFAAAKDYVVSGKPRGASTITQQLVKNMFKVRTQYSTGLLGKIPGLSILIMKTKEWILATEVEWFNDKEAILAMYANTVDFGNNAFGIKTAARTYYSTTPDSLTVDQCAVLVGLLKATSSYNPRKNPEQSQKRRNVVLYNMVTHGHLGQEEYDAIKNKPTPLHLDIETPDEGKALYFRNAIDAEMKDWCEANDVDFYTDGLKIYTTLDTRMQQCAEEAVLEQMYRVQQNFDYRWGKQPCWIDENNQEIPNFIEGVAKNTNAYEQLATKFPNNPDSIWHYMNMPHDMKIFEYKKEGNKVIPNYVHVNMSPMDSIRHMMHYMHAGFVAIDPTNGFVKAWVGDIDYTTWKYDKVKSMRQPGSTFKLFVYSAAMEHMGLTPCDRRIDDIISMKVYNEDKDSVEIYNPHNAQGYFSGAYMTLREAFTRSINSIAVRTGVEVGIDKVEQTAYDMGILSPLRPNTSHKAKPSLCLGSMDVNLLELTNAYGTIANNGKAHSPVLVTSIVRQEPNGSETEIYRYKDEWSENEAVSPTTAFYMQEMLKAGLTDPGATSQSLRWYVDPYTSTTDFGGKTGTSNNHSDAWFVAVSPHLVAGAWVGGEYRSIHFTSSEGQGSRTALPVCGLFFQKVFANRNLRPQVEGKFVSLGLPEKNYKCDYVPMGNYSEPAYDSHPEPEFSDSLQDDLTIDPDDNSRPTAPPTPLEPGEGLGGNSPATTTSPTGNSAGRN